MCAAGREKDNECTLAANGHPDGLSHPGEPEDDEVIVVEEPEGPREGGPRVVRVPREPTQKEIDAHAATHIPHEDWCDFCMSNPATAICSQCGGADADWEWSDIGEIPRPEAYAAMKLQVQVMKGTLICVQPAPVVDASHLVPRKDSAYIFDLDSYKWYTKGDVKRMRR